MLGYDENRYLTPQEINSMKANNERAQTQNLMNLNDMSMGLNVAKLPILDSFGFLLGNIGGQMYNNYRQRGDQKKIDAARYRLEQWRKAAQNLSTPYNLNGNYTAQSLGEYGRSLIPQQWQNQNQNQNNQYKFELHPLSYNWTPNPNPLFKNFNNGVGGNNGNYF